MAGVFTGGTLFVVIGILALVAGFIHPMIYAKLSDFVYMLMYTPWGKPAQYNLRLDKWDTKAKPIHRLTWEHDAQQIDTKEKLRQQNIADYFAQVFSSLYSAPLPLKVVNQYHYNARYVSTKRPRYETVSFRVPVSLVEEQGELCLIGLYNSSIIKKEKDFLSHQETVLFENGQVSLNKEASHYEYHLDVCQTYATEHIYSSTYRLNKKQAILPTLVLARRNNPMDEDDLEVIQFVGVSKLEDSHLSVKALLEKFEEYVRHAVVVEKAGGLEEAPRGQRGQRGQEGQENINNLEMQAHPDYPRPPYPLQARYNALKDKTMPPKVMPLPSLE